MNVFLSKPIAPYMLRDLLEQWLPEGERKKHPDSDEHVVSVHKEEKRKVLDLASVTKCMMGDEALAMHVIEAFVSDFPNQLRALKDSVARGDAVGAARQAHSMKGASASAGGMRIRERAFAMEKAGGAGNLSAVEGGIDALEEEFMEFTKAVQEECHAGHN
jgi:HPt (histidine-containing phosphotransfer) domain-containing protein